MKNNFDLLTKEEIETIINRMLQGQDFYITTDLKSDEDLFLIELFDRIQYWYNENMLYDGNKIIRDEYEQIHLYFDGDKNNYKMIKQVEYNANDHYLLTFGDENTKKTIPTIDMVINNIPTDFIKHFMNPKTKK